MADNEKRTNRKSQGVRSRSIEAENSAASAKASSKVATGIRKKTQKVSPEADMSWAAEFLDEDWESKYLNDNITNTSVHATPSTGKQKQTANDGNGNTIMFDYWGDNSIKPGESAESEIPGEFVDVIGSRVEDAAQNGSAEDEYEQIEFTLDWDQTGIQEELEELEELEGHEEHEELEELEEHEEHELGQTEALKKDLLGNLDEIPDDEFGLTQEIEGISAGEEDFSMTEAIDFGNVDFSDFDKDESEDEPFDFSEMFDESFEADIDNAINKKHKTGPKSVKKVKTEKPAAKEMPELEDIDWLNDSIDEIYEDIDDEDGFDLEAFMQDVDDEKRQPARRKVNAASSLGVLSAVKNKAANVKNEISAVTTNKNSKSRSGNTKQRTSSSGKNTKKASKASNDGVNQALADAVMLAMTGQASEKKTTVIIKKEEPVPEKTSSAKQGSERRNTSQGQRSSYSGRSSSSGSRNTRPASKNRSGSSYRSSNSRSRSGYNSRYSGKKQPRKKSLLRFIPLILVIAICVVGFIFALKIFDDKPFNSDDKSKVEYTITSGISNSTVASDLLALGLIDNEFIYKIRCKVFSADYEEGTYKLSPSYSTEKIINILSGYDYESDD